MSSCIYKRQFCCLRWYVQISRLVHVVNLWVMASLDYSQNSSYPPLLCTPDYIRSSVVLGRVRKPNPTQTRPDPGQPDPVLTQWVGQGWGQRLTRPDPLTRHLPELAGEWLEASRVVLHPADEAPTHHVGGKTGWKSWTGKWFSLLGNWLLTNYIIIS